MHRERGKAKTVPVARTTLVLLLFLGACAAPPPPPPPPDPGAAKAETIELLESLEKSFYTHWGSVESTSEYAKLGPDRVGFLREVADANGPLSLMALRVLAKRAPGERFTAAAKSIIYCSALQRETCFNRWGVISPAGFLPGVYGNELLSLGAAAGRDLQRALRDTRRAPVLGGQDERIGRLQADRVCDYAWVFLATIFDRPLVYHADPRHRDPQIHELDLWLDRRGK